MLTFAGKDRSAKYNMLKSYLNDFLKILQRQRVHYSYSYQKVVLTQNIIIGRLCFQKFLSLFWFSNIFLTYQYSIRLIGVLARKGGVHCQAHAVAHDGEQDEKVKWLPLHKSNAMLSQGIFKREATHGLLSPVRRGLGSHPPCWFLGVHLGHLDFVAIGRRAIQSGVPSRGEVGSFSPWKISVFSKL